MQYRPGQKQFIRFADSIINIDHIVEIQDDSITGPKCVTIRMVDGSVVNVSGATALEFAENVGLSYVDFDVKPYKI